MLQKIKKIIFIFTITLIIGGFYLPKFAHAGDILDINFFGYDPLFDEANFVPEESVSRLVEIKNKTDEIQPIAVKAEKNYDDGLGEQMEMRIMEDSHERYKGSMTNFFNAGEIYLSSLDPNATTQYNFIASFYETANNNFQGLSLNFKIIIGSQSGESIGGENGNSGGGYQYMDLIISNEGIVVNNTSATISWMTNRPATSRVIYDIISHPDISQTDPPNYGYEFSNNEDTTRVVGHSMDILGLSPNTQYFFRPVSKASPEKYGKELSFTTTNSAEKILVLGMEGEPDLKINKKSKTKTANPGDEVIYEIKVENLGSLMAYNVILDDKLPEGFSFVNGLMNEKSWNLGDIESGEFSSVEYLVKIKENVNDGNYINIARVRADNFKEIMTQADLDVSNIVVLGAELTDTGFSNKELFIILFSLMLLILVSLFLRRKIS